MSLPPYARRLDVRATRAAFAAGTLGTVRDHPGSEHEQGRVETGDADRHNHDAMPLTSTDFPGQPFGRGDTITFVSSPGDEPGCELPYSRSARSAGSEAAGARWTEAERQAFLRRAQHVDPRERRA